MKPTLLNYTYCYDSVGCTKAGYSHYCSPPAQTLMSVYLKVLAYYTKWKSLPERRKGGETFVCISDDCRITPRA